MDGSNTVKDLVVAYFLEYGSFAFGRVATLVEQLKAAHMLAERPVNVYQQVHRRLERRRPGYWPNRVWHTFLQQPFAIDGLDRFVGGAYRWGGRLLFTSPIQILFLAVSAVGLYAFTEAFRTGGYGVVTIAGSLGLGLAGLVLANLAAIFLHEMAHALTVKHFGREVRRGGFMFYFGMPAFFVDTTDIWLEPKRARLAVTWAGPYSGLILAGLASIVISLQPGLGLNPLLFQFAFISYLSVFLNLNPLLELDGYYLLMDWLDIPMLRRKSLDFVRTGLWDRFKTRGDLKLAQVYASLSREEKVFAVFGLLSAMWTAYAVYMGAFFWQRRLAGALRDLWTHGGEAGKIILALGAATLSLVFVLSIGFALVGVGRKALEWVIRQGIFVNTWNAAALLLVVTMVLVVAPRLIDYPALPTIISLLALAAAALFAWRTAADYGGSRYAPVFWLFGLFALSLLLSLVAGPAAGVAETLSVGGSPLSPLLRGPVAAGLGHMALALLFLAGLLLFADTDLGDLHPLEKVAMAGGLTASFGLVMGLARAQTLPGQGAAAALLALTGAVVPVLAITLLLPTLVSFWSTAFGPAWAMLAASFGAIVAATLLGYPASLAYLLLASGLLLHHLAYRSIGFFRDAPESTLDQDDGRRLQRAFAWTVTDVLSQFRQVGGSRPARALVERFNSFALAADWRISLAGDHVEDSLPNDRGLIKRGEVYAAALTLFLDLVTQEVGEKLTVRALQRAYDRLPWEEREVGGQYLYCAVERSEALSQEFHDTQRDYRGLLERMPLFATLDTAEIELLCSRLRAEEYAPRRAIIRQGEKGDRFYIIRRGHVEVTARTKTGYSEVQNRLGRGDYFGELALLQDVPRNATCRAVVPTEVLSLSREDFERLVRSRFDMHRDLSCSIMRVNLLRRMPLFSELDAQQIELMASHMQEETYEPGETLIQQGEPGKAFYVIETGRVQVSLVGDGEERPVTERGPGEYVGEIALVLDVPATASVVALGPTRVLALHREEFDRLVAGHLYASRRLERDVSRRMTDLRRAAVPSSQTSAPAMPR
jgi:putative peptide zinc metalloprotease protein